MRLKYKVWLEHNGKQVFGDGIYRLLVLIDEYGSINQAAHVEKMSYRQAWGKIKQIEKRLNIKLLDRRIGGESGGGATLTQEGKKLLNDFREITQRTEEFFKEISKGIE